MFPQSFRSDDRAPASPNIETRGATILIRVRGELRGRRKQMIASRNLVGSILRQSVISPEDHSVPQELAGLERLGALDELARATEFHRVTNYLHLRWRHSEGIGRQISDRFAASYQLSTFSHLRILAELQSISQVFGDREIPWIVVKGPVLAEGPYPRFDLRNYADLDLVIPAPAFDRAIRALEDEGFRLLDRNWHLLVSEMKGELHLLSPMGVVVDAHWNLINDLRTREGFAVHTEVLFDSARTIDVGNVFVPSPSPSEHLVYLAVHAGLSGGEKLIWMKDIQESVANEDIDWDRVAELASEWRVGSLVALMLDRTRRVVGLSLSGDDIAQIARSRFWTRTARIADRISPPSTIAQEGSPSRIVARASRPSPSRSTAELARRSISWAANRAGLVRGMDEDEAARLGSAYMPTGDSRDRETYFAMVTGKAGRV